MLKKQFLLSSVVLGFAVSWSSARAAETKEDKKVLVTALSPGPPLAEPDVIDDVNQQPEQAVDIKADYIGDAFRNFYGGTKVGGAYLGLLSVRGTFDLEKLANWSGTTLYVHLQGTHGEMPNKWVGDAHVTDNIQGTADTGKVYEAYLVKDFADKKVSALFGLYDMNSEFYVNAPAVLFLNSSLGVGYELSQTGPNGPSIFPTTALAARVQIKPTSQYYLRSAIISGLSGNPNNPYGTHVTVGSSHGALVMNEVGWTPTEKSGKEEDEIGKLAFGSWIYTTTFDHLNEVDGGGNAVKANNNGWYILADYPVAENISAFLRYGEAAPNVNNYCNNLMGGFYFKGLFGRTDDEAGIAFSNIEHSKNYEQAQVASSTAYAHAETVYELTYKWVVNSHLEFQPDLQYVVHPGTDPNLKDSLSGILRFKVSL